MAQTPEQLQRDFVLHPAITALWDGLNLGITVTDGDSRILYMNDVQKKLDGFERIKVLGKQMRDVYYARGDQSITQECLEQGKPIINKIWVYQSKANKLNQTIHTLYPLYDSDLNINGTITFITEYYQANETLNRIQTTFKDKKQKNPEKKLTTFGGIIGNDPQFNAILERAKRASYSNVSVMICGESGTGKELVAQAIHSQGQAKSKSFVPINCAAIPEHLLESMLFGTVKGAFTGATDKVGLFEAAGGGTILLDEINSMPLGLQAKLLRVLQERKIRKIGSLEEKPFEARIISTMNISPIQALEKKQVRLDLFYRLAMVILEIPPLRKRKLDIPLLCEFFLKRNKKLFRSRKLRLASDVYTQFFDYDWPGNVRELEHVIYSALHNLGSRNVIEKPHLNAYFHNAFAQKAAPREPDDLSATELVRYIKTLYLENQSGNRRNRDTERPPPPASRLHQWADQVHTAVGRGRPLDLKQKMKAAEAMVIEAAMEASGHNLSKAAKQLGLAPSVMHYKLKNLGLRK